MEGYLFHGQGSPISRTSEEAAPSSDPQGHVRPPPAQQTWLGTVQTGTLLVVDDDPDNRDMLTRRLQRQGYDVVTAENGEQALALVRDRKFDLMLLDMIMPGLDGRQVLARLKADDSFRHLPVLMISALDDIDGIVRCIGMGRRIISPSRSTQSFCGRALGRRWKKSGFEIRSKCTCGGFRRSRRKPNGFS